MTIYHGDALKVLRELPDESVHKMAAARLAQLSLLFQPSVSSHKWRIRREGTQ